MNTQKTRKSCDDYVEYARVPCSSLAKAKTMVEELRVMRPEMIHVIQSGKPWEVVSYAYHPIPTLEDVKEFM